MQMYLFTSIHAIFFLIISSLKRPYESLLIDNNEWIKSLVVTEDILQSDTTKLLLNKRKASSFIILWLEIFYVKPSTVSSRSMIHLVLLKTDLAVVIPKKSQLANEQKNNPKVQCSSKNNST